jgi:NTE family protein
VISLENTRKALVLQGGGALGAYQAGVFEELAKHRLEPDWVAGVSIGAINAALIVGNPPERRVARLREFWDLVSGGLHALGPIWGERNATFHRFSAALSTVIGVEGFYRPRVLPPLAYPDGTDAARSIYDTSPLHETLKKLVDFDRINDGPTRLSLGAVNVRTGNSEYFDNRRQKIGPEHIMASGALPPAFPPVFVDGEPYWDGGIVSNTPLQYVLDNRERGNILIAQVDLFSARGGLPRNLTEVMTRQKDIQYSSRTRFNSDQAAERMRLKKALTRLIDRLPPEWKDDPEVRALSENCDESHIDIVHLIYHCRIELDSKDNEFSRSTLREHWQAGQHDVHRTIVHPDWLLKSSPDAGITVYDLAHHPPKVAVTG